MFGTVTTVLGGANGDVSININHSDNNYDAVFSVPVTIVDALLGDVITFGAIANGRNAGDATVNVNAGQPLSWFCPVGTIEQTLTSDGTGAIEWYMTFRPLEEGVTVIVQ